MIAAALGWAVGTAYRRDLLPGAYGWRVPGWMVGEEGDEKGGFDSLRQRLESERDGTSTGILAQEGTVRRRTLGEMLGGQFGARE